MFDPGPSGCSLAKSPKEVMKDKGESRETTVKVGEEKSDSRSFYFIFVCVCVRGAMPWGLQDLSSLTRDQTRVLGSESLES